MRSVAGVDPLVVSDTTERETDSGALHGGLFGAGAVATCTGVLSLLGSFGG